MPGSVRQPTALARIAPTRLGQDGRAGKKEGMFGVQGVSPLPAGGILSYAEEGLCGKRGEKIDGRSRALLFAFQ